MSFNLEDVFKQIVDTEQQVQNRLALVAAGLFIKNATQKNVQNS